MIKNNFAKVQISIPNGTFNDASIKINGVEMGHAINALDLKLDTQDHNLAIVTVSFLSNVEIEGMFKIDDKYKTHRSRSNVYVYPAKK